MILAVLCNCYNGVRDKASPLTSALCLERNYYYHFTDGQILDRAQRLKLEVTSAVYH